MEDSKTKNNENYLCPSYVAKPGAELFGIINSNGHVDYLNTTIAINEDFIARANKGRTPEKRFRFAGNCAKSGCKQWKNHECGLVHDIVEIIENPVSEALQHCPIRQRCRWYMQRAEQACAQCNEVVRNIETQLTQQQSIEETTT